MFYQLTYVRFSVEELPLPPGRTVRFGLILFISANTRVLLKAEKRVNFATKKAPIYTIPLKQEALRN